MGGIQPCQIREEAAPDAENVSVKHSGPSRSAAGSRNAAGSDNLLVPTVLLASFVETRVVLAFLPGFHPHAFCVGADGVTRFADARPASSWFPRFGSCKHAVDRSH